MNFSLRELLAYAFVPYLCLHDMIVFTKIFTLLKELFILLFCQKAKAFRRIF